MSAVTRIIYVVDSTTAVTPVFGFSTIDLLPAELITARDQIKVYLRRLGESINSALDPATDYTIDGVLKNVTVDGSVGLVVGDVITINRETPLENRLLQFDGVSYLNSENQNNNGDNLLHLIQEINTDVGLSLKRSADLSRWDAEALEVANAAPGTRGTSLATVAQVRNLIAGADTAEVTEVFYDTAIGDGVQDKFVLVDFPKSDTEDHKIFVTFDGVTQTPTTDYTYGYDIADGHPAVTFVTPPPAGVNITFRVLSGQVQAVIANDSINGNAIVDGSIDPSKLGFGSGSARRFLVIGTGGSAEVRQINKDDIQSFDASVRANRLDQMAPPTADVNLAANKIVNLTAGTASTDAVNKGQMDAADAATVAAAISSSVTAAMVRIGAAFQPAQDTGNTWSRWINTSSKPAHVICQRDGGNGLYTLQVGLDTSSYIKVGEIPATTPEASISVMVPPGGAVRFTSAFNATPAKFYVQPFL